MEKPFISAVIIDDDIETILLLVELLTAFPAIKIAGTARNLEDGVKLIKSSHPEIVFLDINLPGRNGLELYKEFKAPNFKIIFCTANQQYAVDAIGKSANGFLLKPVDMNQLTETLNKVYDELLHDHQQFELEDQIDVLSSTEIPGENILIDVEHGFIVKNTSSIEYCYAKNSYSVVVMNTQKELAVPKSLKELQEILPEKQFYRTHKSFLVNIYYIQKFVRGKENYLLLSGGVKIPVSVRVTSVISKDIKRKLTV
ncbi:MAG TPA: LytTR family DNA-binding domain-containing protein [Paludibacter sp.]